MATYLLTYIKHIPVIHSVVGGPVTTRSEPWHTTISATGIDKAKDTARYIGRSLRQRLGKGYDIELESVEFVV